MIQPPVIVLPGIIATILDDYYPIVPEEVWSAVLHKEYERIALHPDDVRYEAIEPARVLPGNPFDLVYSDLVEALRHDLTKKSDKPTPVFPFGYDWRQDCERTAAQLGVMIEEVLARTKLLPHYRDETVEEVDLVGHSMGGLIIGSYLAGKQRTNQPSKVRRVVTIGTPFRGSIDAIQKLTTGMGALTGLSPRDRERESARTIPALYQLLPIYEDAIKPDPGMPGDIFDIGTWQPSLVQTLREYIRVVKAKVSAEDLLKSYLDRAKSFLTSVNALSPTAVLTNGEDDWLPIVGIDVATQLYAEIKPYKGKPWFEFPEAEDEGPGSVNTGDGTVPFLGALPGFLPKERLVCVSPKELSMWELADRLMINLAGFHAFLARVNLVQRIVIRFLRDDFDADFMARTAPGVQTPAWPKWLKVI